jgi:hypothetical protein
MDEINVNNINEQSNSMALNLEALNLEYKNLLISYQQATINYVNYLQDQSNNQCDSSNNSADKNCWDIIKNQAFWGASGISQSSVISPEECATSCAKTSECSGATYNPDNNTCILRKGEGIPIPTEGSYAIVSKGKKLLQIVEHINNRLTEINEKITNLIEKGRNLNNLELSSTQKMQQKNLLKNYYHLVKERSHIKNMLNQYQDTEREMDEGNILVTKNYYTYILLFGLAIIIVFILIKLSLPSSISLSTNTQYGGSKMTNNILYILFVLFFILLMLLVVHFSKKNFT